MYRLITPSVICSPTVLAKYPCSHKCPPQSFFFNFGYSSNTLLLDIPFIIPTTFAIEYLGGNEINRCIWSSANSHSLFQNQIAQLFYKTIALPALLPPQQEPSSYTSDTILNDTSLHKQHDSYSLMTQGYYINGFPIEENPLMRFSSPTKSRSIQTLSS
jgi:hypothetical protein